ncbi:MAG: phosphatidylserine/phosphatidylglycerophosphate/cardiolipin synthase family protein [Bacteroidales bacterium]|jgi:cardiolipin synthase|nr:phosphatidylserine/phosphatidylglycerophosphate/cardiolipin synthase family protein [Bacteroidales bacterium]
MKFRIIDDTLQYYNLMLNDIAQAHSYIFLETYKFANDHMGVRFRDALTRKCREGLNVKILIDSWGKGPISETFFSELINLGGEVKFFEKIKINTDLFTRGHRRDHRKILVVDDAISYIGSANITGYNLNWRELCLRMEGELALSFKKVFLENFEAFNPYIITNKVTFTRKIKEGDFEIIRDVPSIQFQRLKKRYTQLIKKADRSVVIETPYFLPGFMLRKAMMDASNRGVDVTVILPKHSDVRMIDILRNKYLGILHNARIKLLFYLPYNLHAKLLMIDNEVFSISSANFDYRSFRYQYEIALIGSDNEILRQLNEHIAETIRNSHPFDHEEWTRRPMIEKIFEWILLPLRHFF